MTAQWALVPALAALALLTSLLARLASLAAAAAGYKAKTAASAWFACERRIDPNAADEVAADAYKAMRLFPGRVDASAGEVVVGLPGLSRRAVRRPGRGAVLVSGPLCELPPAPAAEGGADDWPEARGPEALERVCAAAFDEPDTRRLRRTRAVLVAKDGRLLCERYAAGFTKESRLPGWSMTKSAFSALAGALAREGSLSLDRRDLLAQWAGDARARISVEDLLRMRSGLRFSEVYSDPGSDVVRMLYRLPDAAAFAASRPLTAAPGARWQYSSGTTNILSRVMRETLGDEDYFDFPRRALFEPLGMTSAVLEADASGTFVGSSFLYATARDWARLGELFRLDGVWRGARLLPPGWASFCATPTPQSPGGCYGAHWWLKLARELGGDSPAAARLPGGWLHALGHEGQCLSVLPAHGLVVVRLGLSIYIDAWNHAQFLCGVLEALGLLEKS